MMIVRNGTLISCVVSRDGLLDARAPAFTHIIDRGPAQAFTHVIHWGPARGDRAEAMAWRAWEQDDCDMLLISAV